MKKMLAALAALGGSVAAFAEGTSSIGTIDTTPVQDIATSITGWITSVIPIILPVLGGVLVFFLVKWAWRVIKSFMNAGK